MNETWRKPLPYVPPPAYHRKPPADNYIEQLAHILSRRKHGNIEYEPCDCCSNEAKTIWPEVITLVRNCLKGT